MLNFVFSYFNHYSFNLVAQWVRQLDYLTTHISLSPIRHGFAPGLVNYKKWCTWLAVASEKVYQLLAHGRWFSPDSSTTKTGLHDIAEILLSGIKHNKSNQINHQPVKEIVTPKFLLRGSGRSHVNFRFISDDTTAPF